MKQLKQCSKCSQVKPVSEFPKSGIQNGVQYYRTTCKLCTLSDRGRRRQELLAQGLIECTTCKQTLPISEFYDDDRRRSGKRSDCKSCTTAAILAYRETRQGQQVYRTSKQRYRQSTKGKTTNREYAKINRQVRRWHQQESARHYVYDAIRRQGFPKPAEFPCADCSARAEQYHHESYDREHWLDVIPLCTSCHRKRHNSSLEVQR